LKILARHLAIDMYNCKSNKIVNAELLQGSLQLAIEESGLTLINADIQILEGEHAAALILLKEGHITVHTYPDLNYAAVDIFTCSDESQPEKAVNAIRRFLKPEKTKMTYLKRGDFGSVKDMKPKIKTKLAPLRRIRNTGVKVMHFLSRRKTSNK